MGHCAQARQQLPDVSIGGTPLRRVAAHVTSFFRCNREVRLDDLKPLKDISALLHVQADVAKA